MSNNLNQDLLSLNATWYGREKAKNPKNSQGDYEGTVLRKDNRILGYSKEIVGDINEQGVKNLILGFEEGNSLSFLKIPNLNLLNLSPIICCTKNDNGEGGIGSWAFAPPYAISNSFPNNNDLNTLIGNFDRIYDNLAIHEHYSPLLNTDKIFVENLFHAFEPYLQIYNKRLEVRLLSNN